MFWGLGRFVFGTFYKWDLLRLGTFCSWDVLKLGISQLVCSTEEKSDVSGPIRSIKMCSFVQCAMQRKSVYCGAMACLAQMEQGPITLHPEHLPPPPLPDHWGLSLLAALKMDGSGQCSGQCEKPNLEPAATGQCMCILFFINHLVILSFGASPKWFFCIVLIVVTFSRFD
jgi:hypothetical protein